MEDRIGLDRDGEMQYAVPSTNDAKSTVLFTFKKVNSPRKQKILTSPAKEGDVQSKEEMSSRRGTLVVHRPKSSKAQIPYR
jgi:hypothetical protein